MACGIITQTNYQTKTLIICEQYNIEPKHLINQVKPINDLKLLKGLKTLCDMYFMLAIISFFLKHKKEDCNVLLLYNVILHSFRF